MRQVTRYLTAAVYALVGLGLLDAPAIARPIAPLSQFTPAQLQRISRDLNRSNAEDFFRRGQEKLEQEVQLLNRKRNLFTEDLLQVNPEPQVQPEPSSPESHHLKSRSNSAWSD